MKCRLDSQNGNLFFSWSELRKKSSQTTPWGFEWQSPLMRAHLEKHSIAQHMDTTWAVHGFYEKRRFIKQWHHQEDVLYM